MSILSNFVDDILSLIYPPRCLMCQEPIHNTDSLLCTKCLSTMTYTRFWEYSDNAMALHARELQSYIHHASAMLFYDMHNRKMIHRLKYSGEWNTAKYLGEMFGSYLSQSELYTSVDLIIPVPLHPLRRIGRGYNQAEHIALGIASKLGCDVNFNTLYRCRYTSAQARKSRVDRWDSQSSLFRVRHPEQIEGKHILIVDDVYTTGATIFRCAEALHFATHDCQISIVTLATSHEYCM